MFELTGSNWTWCYRILSATLSSIVVVSFLCSASLNRLCSGWLLQFTGWRHLPEREKDGSMNYETKDRFFGRFIVGVRDFLFVACVYACEWFPLRLAMPIADRRSFDLEGPKRSKGQFDWKFKLLTADYCHFWWSRTKALFNKRNGRFQADERLPINSFHLHGNDHCLNAQRRRFAPAYVKLRGKFFSQDFKSVNEVEQPEAAEHAVPKVHWDLSTWQQVLSGGGRLPSSQVVYGDSTIGGGDDDNDDDGEAAATRNINRFIVTCQNRLRQLVSRRAFAAASDDVACCKVVPPPFEDRFGAVGPSSLTASCKVNATSFPLVNDNTANRVVLCRTAEDKQGETTGNDKQAALCTSLEVDQPIDMDIDLDGAIQRFEHYCSVYSDSPLSSYTSKQRLKRRPKESDQRTDDQEELANNTCAPVDAGNRGRLASLTVDGAKDVDDKNRKLVTEPVVARVDRTATTTTNNSVAKATANGHYSTTACLPQPHCSGHDSALHVLPSGLQESTGRHTIAKRNSPRSTGGLQQSELSVTLKNDGDRSGEMAQPNVTVIRHRVCISSVADSGRTSGAISAKTPLRLPAAQPPMQKQADAEHQGSYGRSPQRSAARTPTSEEAVRKEVASRGKVEQRHYAVAIRSEDIEKLLQPLSGADVKRPPDQRLSPKKDGLTVCTSDQQYLSTYQSSETASPSLCSIEGPSTRSTTPALRSMHSPAHEYRRKLDEERELSRSIRRHKYKSRIDRAKKEFLESRSSVSDLFKSREEFAKKFKISMDDMESQMRDPEPARGPYMEYLSRSGNLHITAKDVQPRYLPPRSKYDRLHREMVDRAEKLWANYQKRKADSRLNLYAKSRAFSTGCLEATAADEQPSLESYFHADETDLDEVHQRGDDVFETAGSYFANETPSQEHYRARSADFLLSKANREQVEPPENQLRRVMGAGGAFDDEEKGRKLSEHELRFKKSMEKLHLPDWYLQSKYAGDGSQTSPRGAGVTWSRKTLGGFTSTPVESPTPVMRPAASPNVATRCGQPWTYGLPSSPSRSTGRLYSSMRDQRREARDFAIPVGFFDKYKDEIEELRKSRSELNRAPGGPLEAKPSSLPPKATSVRPPPGALSVPVAAVKPTQVQITETYTIEKKIVTVSSQPSAFSTVITERPKVAPPAAPPKAKRPGPSRPGYTVSAPPSSWNVPKQRDSVVVEVLESDVTPRTDASAKLGFTNLTLEEALDSMLALADAPRRLDNLEDALASADAPKIRPMTPNSFYRPAIFVDNDRLMERCAKAPSLCRKLLQKETVWVRCNCCGRIEEMSSARGRYVSCRHCYTYYCSYGCRSDDWQEHKRRCTYARVNTVCKEVIIRVKKDLEVQRSMSLVAQRGYADRGRGSVNLRFLQLHVANQYIANGWPAIASDRKCLSYLTISDLIELGKSADLVATCRQYNPKEKFILSVSIMVEIDQVPQTPSFLHATAFQYDQPLAEPKQFCRMANGHLQSRSLPPSRRMRPPVVQQQQSASSVLNRPILPVGRLLVSTAQIKCVTPSTAVDKQLADVTVGLPASSWPLPTTWMKLKFNLLQCPMVTRPPQCLEMCPLRKKLAHSQK
uniref:MYND-type domain-containing protein n=1 Tax=Trichuris muris TaxID=70415 RepID=A0A5S6QYM6_TRIMR